MTKDTSTPVSTRVADAAAQAVDATAQALDNSKRFVTESVGNASDAAQRQLGTYASATRDYLEKAPMKSALIAAAVGAAAAALAMALLRKGRDQE